VYPTPLEALVQLSPAVSMAGLVASAVALYMALRAFARSRRFNRYADREDEHNLQALEALLRGCGKTIGNILENPGGEALSVPQRAAARTARRPCRARDVHNVGDPAPRDGSGASPAGCLHNGASRASGAAGGRAGAREGDAGKPRQAPRGLAAVRLGGLVDTGPAAGTTMVRRASGSGRRDPSVRP